MAQTEAQKRESGSCSRCVVTLRFYTRGPAGRAAPGCGASSLGGGFARSGGAGAPEHLPSKGG